MTPRNEPPDAIHRVEMEERLTGCGLVVAGLVCMGVAVLFWQFGPMTLPVPPGMPSGFMPMTSPIACMVPIIAVLSAGLVLIGLRKLLTGE